MHVHNGTPISSMSSPGLRFLKAYTAAIDSTSENTSSSLSKFLTPESKFIYNGQPAISAGRLLVMLQVRNSKLSKYIHNVNKSWELVTDSDDGAKSTTVMYESMVELAFKGDEGNVIRVPQFTILELQYCEVDDMLKVVESRVYTDRSSVRG